MRLPYFASRNSRNVVPIVFNVLSFDLTNIGKYTKHIYYKCQKLPLNFQQSNCWVVGGLGCVGVKLNVVFLCRQVRWQNTSFNFAKRWHFVCRFSVRFCLSCRLLGLRLT